MKKKTLFQAILACCLLVLVIYAGTTTAKYFTSIQLKAEPITIQGRTYEPRYITWEDTAAYTFDGTTGIMTVNDFFFIPGTGEEEGKWYYLAGIKENGFSSEKYTDAAKVTKLDLPELSETNLSIGEDAFKGWSSLTTLTLPANVTSFSPSSGMTALKNYEVATGNTTYSAADGVLYNNNKTKLLDYPAGKEGAFYAVANGVTIKEDAFAENNNLTAIKYNGTTSKDNWDSPKATVFNDAGLSANISTVSGNKDTGYTVTVGGSAPDYAAYALSDGTIDYAPASGTTYTIPKNDCSGVTTFELQSAKMYAFATLDGGFVELKIYNRPNRIADEFVPDNMAMPAHILCLPEGKPSASADPEGGSTTWVDTAETDVVATSSNFRVKVQKVTFQDPIQPTSTRWWFNCFRKCTSFTFTKDGKNMLDTSQVTDMGCMFRFCNAVISLDLSTFNTAKVTDMERMFSENKLLTSLNLSGWNTANVTDMQSMFWTCSVLEEINISHFNTANVTTMYQMFGQCYKLSHLNLSNFQTSSVTTMEKMFYNCSGLYAIKIGSGWKTAATTTNVFYSCTALVYQDGQLGSNTVTYTGWDGTKQKANFKVDGYTLKDNPNTVPVQNKDTTSPCPTGGTPTHLAGEVLRSDLTNRVEYGEKLAYTIPISAADSGGNWDSHVLTLAPAKMYAYATLPSTATATNPGQLQLYYRLNRIDNTKFKPDNKEADDLKIYNLWDYWWSMVSDYANPEGATAWYHLRNDSEWKNPSPVGSVKACDTIPFAHCKNLFHRFDNCTEIDLTKFDTSKAVNMQQMFDSCKKLATLDVSNIITSSATNLSGMFSGCVLLTELNVNHFVTTKVTSMSSMFSSCSKLKALNVTKFNTSKVTNMASMFYQCNALTSLDVTNFDTSKVTAMNNMFQGCSTLTSLDVTNFVTNNVTTMRSMFNSCTKLQGVDVTGFNTAKVTSMAYMFKDCKYLTSLDLRSFETSKVTTMYQMFRGDERLVTIIVGNGWNTGSIQESGIEDEGSTGMFSGCNALKGQNGTPYNVNVVDKTYAREDYGPTSTRLGYLTHVDAKPYAFATIDDLGVGAGTMRVYTRKIALPTVGTTWDDGSYNTYTVAGLYKLPAGTPTGYEDPDGAPGWQTIGSSKAHAEDSKVKTVTFVDICKPTSTATWFQYFEKCTSMDLKNLDTSDVTTMYAMFNFAKKLTSIDVTHFDTSKVASMQSMFAQCYKLTELDLSSFTTKQYVTITWMFNWSHNLKTIYVGDNWNPANLTVDNGPPFDNAKALVGGNGTKYDPQNVGKDYARVDGLDGNPGYFTYGGKHATKVYLLCEINGATANMTELTANSDNVITLTGASLPTCVVTSNKNPAPLTLNIAAGQITIPAAYCAPGQVVRIADPKDIAFATLDSANHLRIYLRKGNLPKVGEVFDGHTVTAMYKWPCGQPDDSEDPYNVTSDWRTIQGTVQTVTVVDSIKPVSTFEWFNEFAACTGFNIANLDTSNVTTMLGMFNKTTVATLDLSHFNTANVENMNSMFANAKFTTLDLSSFDTSNVKNMGWMFSGDGVLTKITVGDNWTTANVTTDTNMFSNCTSIKGGSGTTFNSAQIGKEYARVDGLDGKPGYFTSSQAAATEPEAETPTQPEEPAAPVVPEENEEPEVSEQPEVPAEPEVTETPQQPEVTQPEGETGTADPAEETIPLAA